jgi:hypothetical protein
MDPSYLLKYPKYNFFYQDELELKAILEKNDMRMKDLGSSKIVIYFK